jgi:large conductance mechanosensitive channel
MLQEFKDFINKGNLVDLAVAFVLGGAFAKLVTSFIDNIIAGIISGIFGKPDLSGVLSIWGNRIRIGSFLTAVIDFVVIAFVMFLVVKAYNRFKKDGPAAEPSSTDKLLMEIRDGLRGR